MLQHFAATVPYHNAADLGTPHFNFKRFSMEKQQCIPFTFLRQLSLSIKFYCSGSPYVLRGSQGIRDQFAGDPWILFFVMKALKFTYFTN
jgi:hypothetical protein